MRTKGLMPLLVSLVLLSGCQVAQKDGPITTPPMTTTIATSMPAAPTNTAPVLIYSLSNLKEPLTSIPYYSRGEVANLPETTFQQFKEGHQPTLGDSFTAAVIKTANLIGEEVASSANPADAKNSNTLSTKQGVMIKRLDKNVFTDGNERKAEYEITVPSVGKYTVTVEKPSGTDIFFITKITLQFIK